MSEEKDIASKEEGIASEDEGIAIGRCGGGGPARSLPTRERSMTQGAVASLEAFRRLVL